MAGRFFYKVARCFAWLIDVGLVPLALYRRVDFKGKVLISGFLRREVFPANGVYRCRGSLFDLDFSDNLQRDIYLNLFERAETRLFERYIRAGDVCVDVGANVGYFTLWMARLVGERGMVHAFEPDEKNHAKLMRNIELNGLGNRVKVNKVALSNKSGVAKFALTAQENSGWGHIVDDQSAEGSSQVQTSTFDAYVNSTGIGAIGFLKCDIETHEFQFLEGAEATLSKRLINFVIIEYAGIVLNKMGHCVQEYVDLFARHGYQPIEINLDRVAAAGRGVRATDDDTYNLLFARAGTAQ
jgi:FkbM family methyltransferase